MLSQTLQVAFDRLADVCGGLGACLALRNAAGQSRAVSNEDTILVLLQDDSVFQHARILSKGARLAGAQTQPPVFTGTRHVGVNPIRLLAEFPMTLPHAEGAVSRQTART